MCLMLVFVMATASANGIEYTPQNDATSKLNYLIKIEQPAGLLVVPQLWDGLSARITTAQSPALLVIICLPDRHTAYACTNSYAVSAHAFIRYAMPPSCTVHLQLPGAILGAYVWGPASLPEALHAAKCLPALEAGAMRDSVGAGAPCVH